MSNPSEGFGLYENHAQDSRVEGPLSVAPSVVAKYGTGGGNVPLVTEPVGFRKSKRAQSETDYETWVDDGKANCLNLFDLGDTRTTHAIVSNNTQPPENQNIIAPTLTTCNGPRLGCSQEAIEQLKALHAAQEQLQIKAPTLTASNDPSRSPQSSEVTAQVEAVLKATQPVAFDTYNQSTSETNQALGSSATDVNHYGAVFKPTMAVRRLTPKECERLQGFPDNWTQIPWKGKPAEECPDGPRYKACGNSMAVPCMKWIGERIDAIHKKYHPEG